jgi:hypothetical protein
MLVRFRYPPNGGPAFHSILEEIKFVENLENFTLVFEWSHN